MNDTIAHGAGLHDKTSASGGGYDDRDETETYKKLTPAEAQIVRGKIPQVSPWRVVAAQAGAGVICVAVVWVFMQQASAVWSALYGVAATVLPSALLARGMTRGTKNPLASAAGFLFWEMLKIGVAIGMLVIASKVVPHLSWPVLLLTMVVCMKVNWFALLWRAR